MTPAELDQRFALYDQRIARLEDEAKATEWLVTALIGSHPDPGTLLVFVQGAIRTLRDRNVPEGQRASVERLIARLTKLEANVQNMIDQRARQRQKTEQERVAHQERQRRAAQEAQIREKDDRKPGMSR